MLFRPTAHRLDPLVSKLTGGKRSFAGFAAGLPSVILTTAGAKSGKRRTVALLGIPHPDGVAVVATNYGDAKHPGWYYNLEANPAATVTIEGDTWGATARLATPGERDEIWAKGVEIFPGLTKEQAGRQPPHRGLRPQAALRNMGRPMRALQHARWPLPSGHLGR